MMPQEAEDALIEGEDAGAAENGAETTAGTENPGSEAKTPSEIEELAREMGWSEQENWRGDPEKWKDARTFIRSTVDVNRSLSKDVKTLRDETRRIAQTSSRIAEREISRVRAELEEQFANAVQTGDANAAYRASQEINRLEAQPQSQGFEPPVQDFIDRHSDWWEKNDEATAYVMSIAERVARRGGDAEAQAREAESAVRKRFPELFEAPQPRQPAKAQPSVSTPGSRAAPAPKAKTAANLPPDARKAGEDFVKRGRIASLEEYAKLYYEEQE